MFVIEMNYDKHLSNFCADLTYLSAHIDSKGRLIQVVYKETNRSLGLPGLQHHMTKSSAHHCKFVVYDHEYESRDKRKTDKIFFLTWSPDGAPGAMNFMNSRQVLREICEGCLDIFAQDAQQLRSVVLGSLGNGEAELEEVEDDGKSV